MKARGQTGGKEGVLNAGWPAGPKLEAGQPEAPGGPPSMGSDLALPA